MVSLEFIVGSLAAEFGSLIVVVSSLAAELGILVVGMGTGVVTTLFVLLSLAWPGLQDIDRPSAAVDNHALQDIPLEQPVRYLAKVNFPVEQLRRDSSKGIQELNLGLILGQEETLAEASLPRVFSSFFCTLHSTPHSNNNIQGQSNSWK